MKNYAVLAWEWFKTKFAAIAGFAGPLAKSVEVAIAAGDIEGIRARAVEVRELGNKLIECADFLEIAVADGNMSLYEGARALELLNSLADEGEDIYSGIDEDNVV